MSPMGPYEDFADCVKQNQNKRDPEAYCGMIKKAIEGSEFSVTDESDGKKLLLNVEIFQTGVHVPDEGPIRNWTREDVEDIAKAFHEHIMEPVHLKIGHTSDEFCEMIAQKLDVPMEVVRGEGPVGNGKISLGRLVDVRIDDDGVLLGDFECPAAVADLIAKGYTDVSVEMSPFPPHPWALSAVALLGAERPAVKGLAGLEEMAVLADRQPALVAHFSVTPQGLTQHVSTELADLEELEEVSKALDKIVQGRKSAHALRQVWSRVRDKLAALLGREFSESKSSITQEADMDIKKIRAALHMQDEATESEVLTRLGQIMEVLAAIAQALGIGSAPEEMPEEELPEMAEKVKTLISQAKDAKFSESGMTVKLQAAEERITALERDRRLATFQEVTRTFTAIEGTPVALAEQLIEIEDKLGTDARERQVAQWRQTQKYAEQAGVLVRMGTSREGEGQHPLEIEMEKWAKDNDKPISDAYAHFQATRAAEWREWRRSNNNGDRR